MIAKNKHNQSLLLEVKARSEATEVMMNHGLFSYRQGSIELNIARSRVEFVKNTPLKIKRLADYKYEYADEPKQQKVTIKCTHTNKQTKLDRFLSWIFS